MFAKMWPLFITAVDVRMISLIVKTTLNCFKGIFQISFIIILFVCLFVVPFNYLYWDGCLCTQSSQKGYNRTACSMKHLPRTAANSDFVCPVLNFIYFTSLFLCLPFCYCVLAVVYKCSIICLWLSNLFLISPSVIQMFR